MFSYARNVRRAVRGAASVAALAALGASAALAQRPNLGPADGKGLPPLDTGRVVTGTIAPDFTLDSKDGGTVRLSQFRAGKNVVLVFYRGHW